MNLSYPVATWPGGPAVADVDGLAGLSSDGAAGWGRDHERLLYGLCRGAGGLAAQAGGV